MTARSILLVEDDQPSSLLLAMYLELTGQRVVTAVNGLQAYQLAREHRPSLIILDLMMPIMTGEEFRLAQLATPDISDIPVLVISAHPDAIWISKRMRASACLMKPVDLDQLDVVVRELLKST